MFCLQVSGEWLDEIRLFFKNKKSLFYISSMHLNDLNTKLHRLAEQ